MSHRLWRRLDLLHQGLLVASVLFPQLLNYVLVDLWGFLELLQWLLLSFFLCAGFLKQISLPLLFVIDLLKD
jgi:hypothetical protein